MKDVEFPSATEAKLRATSMCNMAVQQAMREVKRSVDEAIGKGALNCIHNHKWSWEVTRSVVSLLQSKGYKAHADDDQREGSWIEVGWA